MPAYKVININDSGFVWQVPLEVIAKNRATYYAERDSDTTYQEEFDLVMNDDPSEGLDWFLNNMDFEDVEKEARRVATPHDLAKPRINSDTCEVTIKDAIGL